MGERLGRQRPRLEVLVCDSERADAFDRERPQFRVFRHECRQVDAVVRVAPCDLVPRELVRTPYLSLLPAVLAANAYWPRCLSFTQRSETLFPRSLVLRRQQDDGIVVVRIQREVG